MKSLKVVQEFKIGSSYFFDKYDDYVINDIDILGILSDRLSNNKSFIFKKDKKDIILYPPLTKDMFISMDLKSNDPIKAGKYLIPEFANYIDLSIEDLKKFENIYNNLDDKHKYQKVIYESYIENNVFKLTEEQRLKAYKEYKKYRS